MKPDKHKDITEQMAEKLRKHSLPYKEGAWERFQEFEASKSKKIVLWPYFTAAAAMLIFAFTLFINLNDSEQIDEPGQIAKTDLPVQIEDLNIIPPVSGLEEEDMDVEAPSLASISASQQPRTVLANNVISDEVVPSETFASAVQGSETEAPKASETTRQPLVQKQEQKSSSFNDGLYKQDFYKEVAEV